VKAPTKPPTGSIPNIAGGVSKNPQTGAVTAEPKAVPATIGGTAKNRIKY